MKTDVREPKQERSIEKKNKIIQAGYELFSECGYYGTNTQEIAKRAGVSTGIVYGYFKDKRDILICVLNIYIERVSCSLMDIMRDLRAPLDFNKAADSIVQKTIEMHTENAKLHNALHSLSATDELVQNEFIALETRITERISCRLKELGAPQNALIEKVHIAMNLVQSFAHEYVFDNHEYINYSVMRKIVIASVARLFEQA